MQIFKTKFQKNNLKTNDILTLNDVKVGFLALISEKSSKRITMLGFCPGTKIKVLGKTFFKRTIICTQGENLFAIRSQDAKKIIVTAI